MNLTMTDNSHKKPLALANSQAESPHLLKGEVSLPAAIIRPWVLEGNLGWMQAFADKVGVKLAPHGKTTMCPEIFARQLRHGAWGMTLATAPQVAVAVEHGVRNVILANQLVGTRNMEIVAQSLECASVCTIVDSPANVSSLGRFFAAKDQTLSVLIEIGTAQGRTGCRTAEQVLELSEHIAATSGLRLVGIEVYEGIVHGDDAKASVQRLLERSIDSTSELIRRGAFSTDDIILTGAGSAWYDIVAQHFVAHQLPSNVLPIIRPGSYAIHDTGIYDECQTAILNRSQVASDISGSLESCLEVWAYIQSIPESGLAIAAMGKRDIAFTDGLPLPSLQYRDGWSDPQQAPSDWEVTGLMDQHTLMRIGDDADIAVGDMVSFSGSHPCLTCDKWRHLHAIDKDYKVVDIWPTYF